MRLNETKSDLLRPASRAWDTRNGQSRESDPAFAHSRSWARWNGALGGRYTLGVEEEVMLLDRLDHSLAHCSDQVLVQLSDALSEHTTPETHAAVVELTTGVHRTAAAAMADLSALREQLALELRPLDLAVACAGMHPLRSAEAPSVSRAERYGRLADSLRFLARREPTLALHVHVGVPDPEDAVRVLNRLREAVPVLLALSANSPFLRGGESGFDSTRTLVFGGFPRTGTPRTFASYDDYVEPIDALIASGALPDPTFLWWDVRLQPALGTVEVRVMDAQTTVAESAPLIALVQSLARLELDGDPQDGFTHPEVLAENRFLAARDGLDARLIDPHRRRLIPVRKLLSELTRDCRPHAAALGCSGELESVTELALANGATCQRGWAANGGDLPGVCSTLVEQFAAQRTALSYSTYHLERSD